MPPEAQDILGLPDLKHELTHYGNRKVLIVGSLKNRPPCPRCQSPHVQIKSSFTRNLRHARLGNESAKVAVLESLFTN